MKQVTDVHAEAREIHKAIAETEAWDKCVFSQSERINSGHVLRVEARQLLFIVFNTKKSSKRAVHPLLFFL